MTVINLEHLFRPRSIALFGADRAPRSIGQILAQNLFQSGFDGPIMPVHATDCAVHGVLAYKSPESLPMAADLAVIAVPPPEVPALIDALGARGTRAAIVASHDFDVNGATEGAALRQQMLDAAKPYKMRIAGPACLGVLVPPAGLNASWAHVPAKEGDLAFVSQSGSLMTAMLDWASVRGVGFSMAVSLGDMADVDFGDVLDYLALDADSRAVLLCIDHIAHPRKFISAARAAARLKPVVVFDAGRRQADDETPIASFMTPRRFEVHEAAFRRAGMLPVPSIADLVAAAATLGTGIRPNGGRLAVLANGCGIADLTGNLVLEEGGSLARLGDATLTELGRALPATWTRCNPINLFADATAARWRDALGPLLADSGVDAIIAVNGGTAVGDTLEAARTVIDRHKRERKPVVAVWLEESTLDKARQLFADGRIPLHDSPGAAVEALMQVVRWRHNQDMLMETPASVADLFNHDALQGRDIVQQVLARGEQWLSEVEAKRLLAAYGIAVVPAREAATPQQAAQVAVEIGFPVTLRLRGCGSEMDAKGAHAALTLDTTDAVVAAASRLQSQHNEQPNSPFPGFLLRGDVDADRYHELALGIRIAPGFGPVVLFGQGGDIGQIANDRAIGLPPLNLNLARLLIAETRVSRLLQGYAGRPAANLDEIAEALVKLSHIGGDLAEVVEIDINPLFADAKGVLAAAVRIRLAATTEAPDARLAIRPYPSVLEKAVTTRKGRTLLLRPIRPEDEPALQSLVVRQSPEDRRLRFFSQIKELDHRMAARLTQIDYDREMALVLTDPAAPEPEILGVMQISADPDGVCAEYAGAVRSDLKGEGLGQLLLEEIIAYAKHRGIQTVTGEVLSENTPMLGLVRKLGFVVKAEPEDPTVMIVSKSLA